jgi:ABC-2 type transport system permease protein
MRRIRLMVLKDLLRQVRSPWAMLGVLAFPLIFSALLGLTFGSESPSIPRVQLLVEDRDGSFLSGMLLSAAANEQMAEYFAVREVGDEGMAMMERGEASALLRIPAEFGEDLLAGRPVELQLVRNPAQGILPEIAEQSMTVLVDVLASGSHMMREPLDRVAGFMEDESRVSAAEVSAVSVAVYTLIEQAEGMILPPAITLETVALEGDGEDADTSGGTGSVFLFVLPGISVWALFMLGDIAMRDILTESTEGTLRRQLSGPVPAWQVVAAKALFTAVIALVSLTLLSAIGWVVAESGVDLVGFAVLAMSLIVAVTGFAAVIYGLARTERQGATISSVVLLVFAFLGGSFVQVNALPDAVRRFSPLTPFYWGTTGFRKLIGEGAGWLDVLPNAGILAAVGAVLLGIGAAFLGRRVRAGATT